MKIKSVWLAAALLCGISARAEVFTLPQLTPAQTEPLFNTLNASLFFRPVEPASGYGKLWGLGAGVSITGTNASSLSSIVSGMSGAYVPSAEVNLGVTLPLGLTVEGGFLPAFTYQSSTFSKWAIGAKWTVNRLLSTSLPVDIAFRVGVTNGSLAYVQTSGGTVNVNYTSQQIAANLVISKNFILVEPFAGIGFVTHSSTLTGTGAGTIFGVGFPAATSTYSANGAALWAHAGLLLNLQILRLSASIDYAFGLVSGSGKVGFSL